MVASEFYAGLSMNETELFSLKKKNDKTLYISVDATK
jgi:hypothetical protein